MHFSFQGDPLSWGPFLPSKWHRQPATRSAVLPKKRRFWLCLGLAVTVACFGFGQFFRCILLPFCSKWQTWTCVLSEVGILTQTCGSWSRVSWISGVLELMLSWLIAAWSSVLQVNWWEKVKSANSEDKNPVMNHTQLFLHDPRIVWWIHPVLKSCKECEYTKELQWDKYNLHHCVKSVSTT